MAPLAIDATKLARIVKAIEKSAAPETSHCVAGQLREVQERADAS